MRAASRLRHKRGEGSSVMAGGTARSSSFDLKTYTVLGTITALPDADGIIFDPTSGFVLVVSGRGKALLSFKPDIDPKSGNLDPPIPLRGEPDFLAADKKGLIYINLMDTHEVAVVNLAARKVIANWPVAPGGLLVGWPSTRQRAVYSAGAEGRRS
jgi:hypothetical protein